MMDREEAKKIIEQYRISNMAEIEKNPELVKPQWPYELFGVECGEGWKHLYQPITDYINEYNKSHVGNEIEIHQIKEKFGGLRYYVSHYTDELKKMIKDAEEASFNTCETCGKHISKPIIENRWIYAECDDCHEKRKEKIRIIKERFYEKNLHKSREGKETED